MTDPKGNSEFCFPETLTVSPGEAEGNIEVKYFVIPPNSKLEKKLQRDRLHDADWLINLPRFQGAHDLTMCESKVHVVVSYGVSEFCSPYGVSEFDPRHITSSTPSGKRI